MGFSVTTTTKKLVTTLHISVSIPIDYFTQNGNEDLNIQITVQSEKKCCCDESACSQTIGLHVLGPLV